MKPNPHLLLKNERGTIRKSHAGKLRIALVYPNSYSVGMSNLAVHTLYRTFNARNEIVCERFFYDRSRYAVLPQSFESGTPLSGFDIIASSLSFELDYFNLVALLKRAEIPMLRSERTARSPFILAGGIAISANPEPLADIVDAVVLGEAEEIITPILDILLNTSAIHNQNSKLLKELSELPGIYIPKLMPSAEHLSRLHVQELDRYPTVSQIITPNTEFKNMFLIELGRGCPYHCRFCLAGSFYRPVRYRSLNHIYEQLKLARELTETKTYPRVGIVATAIADYPQLDELCEEMLRKKIAVSFASLRADKAPVRLLQLLKQSGQKTVTFAPEAGSESLRKSIGKPISDAQLVDMVERTVRFGLLNIKLYFMLGLPNETESDIIALIALVKKLRDVFISASKPLGRVGKLIVAVNPFVPKKGTRFEHERFGSVLVLRDKMNRIRAGLKKEHNLQLQFTSPNLAELEAELSLGSRNLAQKLYHSKH